MQKAYKLRESKFGVDRDYPKEIANARESLYNSLEAKQALQDKVKMYIKYPAKLFIKGVMVKFVKLMQSSNKHTLLYL
jgi:hypothetical protein